MGKYKYIGYYTKDKIGFLRDGSLAATNKMDYISSAIISTGNQVEIISPSWFADDRRGYSGQYTIHESKDKVITFTPSFYASNKITRRIRSIYSRIWLFFYLLRHVKKDEEIIIYHSLLLLIPILLIKKIKKFNLTLEVEEVYCDVKKRPKYLENLEYKLIKSADKYIFSTELLNEKLNKKLKPFVISYGTYKNEPDRGYKFDDGKIHLVYSGIIDIHKRGATNAVNAATFLDENYHIHIIGFGSEKDKRCLQDLIAKVTMKTKCTVTFDGMLQGEDYIQFLQSCDVGLSTQRSEAAYNDTSFPSKILSYLANGLRVVSIKINVIEKSKIGSLMNFYDKDSPEKLAEAIKNIDFSMPYNSRNCLSKLNRSFISDIGNILDIK